MTNTEHPYLLFRKDEAEELRARLQKGPRSQLHLAHAIACCEQFLDPSSEHFFDFLERKSDYWHSRLGNFVITGRLLTLALTGWLADRPEFLEAASQGFLTVVREGICDSLGDYALWRSGIGHDSGKYFLMASLLYDMLFHVMTEEERATIIDHADSNFDFAREKAREARQFIDNNRGSKYFVGLCIMGITFKELVARNRDYAALCANGSSIWLQMGLRHCVGRDGTLIEGPSYGLSHILHLAVAAHIIARCGYRDCRGDVRFGRAGDYAVQEMVYSQGWVNNLNDCGLGPLLPVPYVAGVTTDRPACLWLWDRFGCDRSNPLSPIHPDNLPADFSPVPWQLLWPDDDAPAPASPDECGYPNAKHFRDRGVVSIRSGWGSEDLHVTMISGEPVRTAHRQADQNQVTLYALGELFLIDTGYHETDPQTNEVLTGKVTEAHNLLLIDGEGQSSFATADGWPMGHIESFVPGEGQAYALGDASEAYNSKLVVRRAERHVHAVWRAGIPPYVIWIDDLEADGRPHRYELMLHTAEGNRFEWNEGGILIHGRDNLLDIHLVASAPFEIYEESYGRHPRLHVEQTATRARFVMLLHPKRPGDPNATFSTELAEDTIRVEVGLGGRTATHVFDTGHRPTAFSGENIQTVEGPIWEG